MPVVQRKQQIKRTRKQKPDSSFQNKFDIIYYYYYYFQKLFMNWLWNKFMINKEQKAKPRMIYMEFRWKNQMGVRKLKRLEAQRPLP